MILSNIIFLRYLYICIYIIGLKGLKYLSVIEKSQDADSNELWFCYIFCYSLKCASGHHLCGHEHGKILANSTR